MFFRRRPYSPTLFGLLVRLIMLAWVLVGLFAVIGYAAGWIVIHHDAQSQKETIEIDTAKVQHAAKKAVDEGKDAIDKIRGKTATVPPAQQPATPPAAQNGPGAAPIERETPDASGKTTPVPPPAPNGGQ